MKNINKKSKISWAAAFLLLFFLPLGSMGAMRSSSYVIYENVMHSFDGPVVSNVQSSVSGLLATVEWTTDVLSDSFVIYDTADSFLTSREQGSSVKSHLTHSVELSGLEPNTQYFYRVRSERVNGGLTVDPFTRSFTTGDDPAAQESTSGGGGLLIIDKTDKVAPVISNVRVTKEENIVINWDTDESATSFVEYGRTVSYGDTVGSWATGTAHAVKLSNLNPGALYHFRAISSDSWGNVSYSQDMTFSTTEGEEIGEELSEEEAEAEEEVEPVIDTSLLEAANRRALELIRRLFPTVSLNEMNPDDVLNLSDLDQLAGFIPAPILSGEPRIEVGATEATVYWSSDIESSSQIAYAPEGAYYPDRDEPYQQIVGNTEEMSLSHEVTIYNLSPETTYHFQLRSRGEVGPLARSRDYSFTTALEDLQITNAFHTVENDTSAVFRWVTNKNADSAVRFTPYLGNTLAVDRAKVIRDNQFSVIHEIRIEEFVGGTFYSVELISEDAEGRIASENFDQFATAEDDLPPQLTHIKADSTIFVDRGNKTQTIISWVTNEPSTSKVYYQEGVQGGEAKLAESTDLNENYTKEHVLVITKFKPGLVYSFRVESIDSGGNISMSKIHTFMTAKKKESIIQVIMNILENTFGWMKKIM